MPIHLNNQNGTQIYHREQSASKKYSIFGSNDGMNYGYVAVEDAARNNHGFYTDDTLCDHQKKIIQLAHKAPAPVWTLGQVVPSVPRHSQNQSQQTSVITEGSSKKFVWAYGGKEVYLTGTFDDWKGSIKMTPTVQDPAIFEATVNNMDRSKDNTFKFVVDGKWCHDVQRDFVIDASGNINNILYAEK